MAHVFVHTHTAGKTDWNNQGRDFTRVPVVGEYFALEATGEWYRVELVVHCPFTAEYEAEVYGVQVDHAEEIKKATG